MTRIELSDDETEYSTHFPVKDVGDIMQGFEEMVRMYFNDDLVVDAWILDRADEIFLKNSN